MPHYNLPEWSETVALVLQLETKRGLKLFKNYQNITELLDDYFIIWLRPNVKVFYCGALFYAQYSLALECCIH